MVDMSLLKPRCRGDSYRSFGLMYGAGHCWHGSINMHSRGSSLEGCPGDDQFLSLLDLTDVPGGTVAQRRYPPDMTDLVLLDSNYARQRTVPLPPISMLKAKSCRCIMVHCKAIWAR